MDIMENELVNVAMQIILHAGDARLRVEDALHRQSSFTSMRRNRKLQRRRNVFIRHMSHRPR